MGWWIRCLAIVWFGGLTIWIALSLWLDAHGLYETALAGNRGAAGALNALVRIAGELPNLGHATALLILIWHAIALFRAKRLTGVSIAFVVVSLLGFALGALLLPREFVDSAVEPEAIAGDADVLGTGAMIIAVSAGCVAAWVLVTSLVAQEAREVPAPPS